MKKKKNKTKKTITILVSQRDFVNMAYALGFQNHPMMSVNLHVPKLITLKGIIQ